MNDLPERLTRCADIFLHLYTDRYTDLGPEYDPDLSCPLSDEQIEQLQSDVNHIEEHHGDSGIFDVTNKLKLTTREFLDEQVVPEIMEQMDQPHFVKSFSLFVKVTDEVYFNLKDNVLPDFPGRDDLSKTLYDTCIVKLYTDFEDLLLTVVFNELLEIRMQENITGHNSTYYLKIIAEHFTLFDDSKWRDPYIDNIRLHTAEYAGGLDIDAATFFSKALQRAGAEASLANSFRLGGPQTSRRVKKAVFSGFVQVYNTLEPIDDFINLFEQTENQGKFQNLLKLYGYSGFWPTIVPLLKQRILDAGVEMVALLQPPNHRWTMDDLDLAVWEMGSYERKVYSRLRLRENRGIPLLSDMFLTTFKANFNEMFPNQQDEQKPEEFLANFVEWLVSRKEEDLHNLPPGLTFEGWRAETFENINMLAKHLANKEQFAQNVESRLHLSSQEEARNRNISFYDFLNMENVRNYVTPDIRERLRNEISTRRVSARDIAERKGKVVDWVCAAGSTGSHEEALYNLILDSHYLFVVSVPFFTGCRKSVYIRMTGLQKEILNAVLEWKELSVADLYGIMIRNDITGGNVQARDTVKIVLNSLITEELVKKTPLTNNYTENDIISVNEEKVLEMPYVWISGPIQEDIEFRTNERYTVDLIIWNFMASENTASINDLFAFVQQHTPISQHLLGERFEVLKMRGFIAPSPDQPEMFSYVAP